MVVDDDDDDDDDDVDDDDVVDVRCLPTLALILCEVETSSVARVMFIWITKRGHIKRCQW